MGRCRQGSRPFVYLVRYTAPEGLYHMEKTERQAAIPLYSRIQVGMYPFSGYLTAPQRGQLLQAVLLHLSVGSAVAWSMFSWEYRNPCLIGWIQFGDVVKVRLQDTDCLRGEMGGAGGAGVACRSLTNRYHLGRC